MLREPDPVTGINGGYVVMKYTIEKVLYLASSEDKPLNVSVTEHPGTDLSMRVDVLLRSGMLVEVAAYDSDRYYRVTDKGRIKLLKLQIDWRKRHNKPTDLHELQLETLLGV